MHAAIDAQPRVLKLAKIPCRCVSIKYVNNETMLIILYNFCTCTAQVCFVDKPIGFHPNYINCFNSAFFWRLLIEKDASQINKESQRQKRTHIAVIINNYMYKQRTSNRWEMRTMLYCHVWQC